MAEYFYQWLRNAAFYLVMITAVIQMLPGNRYKKYIRFFTGLVLIVMMTEPVFQVLGLGKGFSELYENEQYEQEVREMEEAGKYLREITIKETAPEGEDGEIKVEEIRIGNED